MTMRDGSDHPMTVEYDKTCVTICPIKKAVFARLEHDGSVAFPEDLPVAEHGGAHYGKNPHISTIYITNALKVHARNAGERMAFTMHSLRPGGVLAGALAADDLPAIMQCAFWKKTSTTRRNLRLMEVLIPGFAGNSMATGVSPEFGLFEKSRYWATFGNAPMI